MSRREARYPFRNQRTKVKAVSSSVAALSASTTGTRGRLLLLPPPMPRLRRRGPPLLAHAIGPDFVDHTLPHGRPQGPTRPDQASKGFLTAVPDLNVAVVQRWLSMIASSRIFASRAISPGASTGTTAMVSRWTSLQTDILRVRRGRITDQCHLEDNLAFLQQIGVVPH